MAESDADKMSRVRMMASGSETWDLSRNDVAALKHVLVSLDAAESALSAVARERDEMATALAAANEDLTAARALLRECLTAEEWPAGLDERIEALLGGER